MTYTTAAAFRRALETRLVTQSAPTPRQFLDPVLSGQTCGLWSPTAQAWQ